MHGNLWEWVEDDWHDNYKHGPKDAHAWIDKPRGVSRVIRGGSWYRSARYCRSAQRLAYSPNVRGEGLGFRLAMSVALGP